MIPIAPVTLAQLPEDWIAERREVVVREGYALRAGAGATIEIKSLTLTVQLAVDDPLKRNQWLRLALPDNAPAFATDADRDAVLTALQGGTAS